MLARHLDPEMAPYIALEIAGVSGGADATWPVMNSFVACTKDNLLALDFLAGGYFPTPEAPTPEACDAATVCSASNAALLARPLCAFEPVLPVDLATHRGYPAQNPENPDDVWGDEERDQQFEFAFRHPGAAPRWRPVSEN